MNTYFNYWTIYGASYGRLAMVLAGTAIRQILFIKIQKNLYGRIQAKELNSSMESLGKGGQGAVTAYYTSDVDRKSTRLNSSHP